MDDFSRMDWIFSQFKEMFGGWVKDILFWEPIDRNTIQVVMKNRACTFGDNGEDQWHLEFLSQELQGS